MFYLYIYFEEIIPKIFITIQCIFFFMKQLEQYKHHNNSSIWENTFTGFTPRERSTVTMFRNSIKALNPTEVRK